MTKIDRLTGKAFWNNAKYHNNNTLVIQGHDNVNPAVYLHGHKIVELNGAHQLTLDKCGWQTVTTKTRMNAILNAINAKVFQKDFAWYVRNDYTNEDYEFFEETITLQLNGSAHGFVVKVINN